MTWIGVSLAGWCAACGSVDNEEENEGFKGVITMTQANTDNVTSGVSCNSGAPDKFIAETTYFRAFRLADHDIRGAFRVTSVSFTVSERVIGDGFTRFPIELSVHNFSGEVGGSTIDTAALGPATITNVDVLATTPAMMPVNYNQPLVAEITEPAFVFKIRVPDYKTQKHKFFLGVTGGGETVPGYSACGARAPETLTGLGFPQHSLLMSITGESY